MGENRFQYIDALRGIAIFGVIICHAGSLAHIDEKFQRFTDLGSYGVQLFFVISAFTIFLTFEKSKMREQGPVRNFFIRRLFRIVPVYWMGIILYSSIYGMSSRGWLPGPEAWHIPMHMALLNLLHPATPSSVVPGGWSISCEVIFYLTVPLWFKLVRSIRGAIAFCVISILGGPLLVRLLAHAFRHNLTEFSEATVSMYWYRNPLNQLGCFSLGILCFFILRDALPMLGEFKKPIKQFFLCMTVMGILLIGSFVHLPLIRQHLVVSTGFALALLALSQYPSWIIVNRMTAFVGRISYSAYLCHFLVLQKIAAHLPKAQLSGISSFFIIFIVGIVIIVPLAWLSFKLIETPAINCGKALIKKSEQVAFVANYEQSRINV